MESSTTSGAGWRRCRPKNDGSSLRGVQEPSAKRARMPSHSGPAVSSPAPRPSSTCSERMARSWPLACQI
eukprot:9685500-Lingulodinium_polyedra.AAC.1